MMSLCRAMALTLLALIALTAGQRSPRAATLTTLPSQEVSIVIGADRHVSVNAALTFGAIAPDLASLGVALAPTGNSAFQVARDGLPLPWHLAAAVYPTVLPEYPELPMAEWLGPFAPAGAVFSIGYEHDLFARGAGWLLFYPLGIGKYLATADSLATATFRITLPDSATLRAVRLDDSPLDPAAYTLTGSLLELDLSVRDGPFTRDLIVEMSIPTPATPGLLAAGLLALLGWSARGRAQRPRYLSADTPCAHTGRPSARC